MEDAATVASLRRLLGLFRRSPMPAPSSDDDELVAEIRRSSEASDAD
jgi:hypothetical protein